MLNTTVCHSPHTGLAFYEADVHVKGHKALLHMDTLCLAK
jgi:hypothetical protein